MRRLIVALGVVAVLVATLGATPGRARAASGDVCTWNGGSGATDLSDVNNYTAASGATCSSLDGAQLVFPATVPASGSSLSLSADLSTGSLVLEGAYTLGGAHTLTLTTTGTAIDATSGGSTISANIAAASTTALLSVEVATGASLDVSGTLSDSSVLLVNPGGGTGTLTLSADNSTTLGATVYVDAGTLEIGDSGALGTSDWVSVSDGAVLALDSGVSVPADVTLGLAGTLEATGNATWAGNVNLQTSSGASVTLAAATGAVLQVPGTVADNGYGTSVTVGKSGWTGTVVLSGVTGTVVTNSNFWGGPTNVAYGTLQVGATNAVSTIKPINVLAGTTLDLHGHNQNMTGTTGSGTITDSVGGGTLNLTASSSYTVPETIAGAANVSVYTYSGATVTLAPASASGNTYTGSTATFGFGVLAIKAGSALGATSGVTVGNSSADGVLQLDGTMTLSAPISIPSGLVEVTGTGSTATLTGAVTAGTTSTRGTLAAAAGDTLAVSGQVTGSLFVGTTSLTGTVTLSNAGNTATTEVVAGALVVPQALGSVKVDAAATFAGTGSVPSLNNYGTVIAGADASTPGTFTVNGFAYLATGSSVDIDIAGTTPGSGYSQLVATGQYGGVDAYGSLHVSVDPSYTPAPGTTFDILTAPWIIGQFTNATDGSTLSVGGNLFLVTYVTPSGAPGPTDVVLTALGAPDPPTNVVATVQKVGHGKTATQSVVLTWDAPANDGGAAITDYLVNVYTYGHGKGGGTYALVSSSPIATLGTELSFTVPDSDLSGGGTYAFTVAAVNDLGTGSYSDYSNAIRY